MVPLLLQSKSKSPDFPLQVFYFPQGCIRIYGGCGADESTVSYCILIHLNYMEAKCVCLSLCVCAFVSVGESDRQ